MDAVDYEAFKASVKYSHRRIAVHPNIEFHLHSGYEIFFLISGDVQYFVENKIYPLSYGSLVVTNNREIHKPHFSSDTVYERVCIEFSPGAAAAFSAPDFDLCACFVNRVNGEMNKIQLSPNQIGLVMDMFGRIEQLNESGAGGSDILRLACFMQLLVLINRCFADMANEGPPASIPAKLEPVLDYINSNLEGDLGLNTLAKKFFMNKFYLCKLFKKATGSSIHSFILYKRVARAKMLIESGCSLMEACVKSGFSDYSNFYRVFARTTGVSPKKYCLQKSRIDTDDGRI